MPSTMPVTPVGLCMVQIWPYPLKIHCLIHSAMAAYQLHLTVLYLCTAGNVL